MTSKLEDVTPPGYIKPKKISEGAFGQVLKVQHEKSGVEYAMKVLPMLKEGDKERVSREVEMLTRFAHPRIVGLHESIDMGGHQAIVMELGTRSLKDLILEYESRGELIPLPLTVMILNDICEGLLWMHTHASGSTAHGDLKPENVLLRLNCRAFLCDLGGSAPMDQQMTSTIGELGTFEYNSPERLMDSKGLATPASDVWSLGVLAYRMVTGKSLFEGLQIFQMSVAVHSFDGTKIPTTIPSPVREVLLKMLEPNVALRTTTTTLFEGGLLERMLGPETALSTMKGIQLATRVNEIREASSDANVKEKTMELEMEKQKLQEETLKLENQLRSLQMSLKRTCERNAELGQEAELALRQQVLAPQTSPISATPEDNVLSKELNLFELGFSNYSYSCFSIAKNKITRRRDRSSERKEWRTTYFQKPITEGVVSVAFTILSLPNIFHSEEDLMIGLIDTLSTYGSFTRFGADISHSIAFCPTQGTLHFALPSTRLKEESRLISSLMIKGGRVVLEVDMDARPRTAVFILNGNVPLTFVSGLPPSIRFGFSMQNKRMSIRFDGLSHLKEATPMRRVHEIKWNREDMKDSEDMYMNGMRSNVLTVQTQMPSLIFTDPSHFRVEDNVIADTNQARKQHPYYERGTQRTWGSFFLAEPISEGVVAISFTYLTPPDKGTYSTEPGKSFFRLIDGTTPIPEVGQPLGKFTKGQNVIDLSSYFVNGDTIVVEIDMDSSLRTAQFFMDGQSTNAVVFGLPGSVRFGFSTMDPTLHVRPISDQMKVIEWTTAGPLQKIGLDETSDGSDDKRKDEAGERTKKDVPDEGNNVKQPSQEETRSEESDKTGNPPSEDNLDKAEDMTVDDEGRDDADEVIDHSSEQMRQTVRGGEESDGDSDKDADGEKNISENDDDDEDDQANAEKKKIQLPTMKLPELLFTHKTHFAIRNNVLTRTEKGTDEKGGTRPSTVLLSEPITKGVVSVAFVILTLADTIDQKGFVNFGLLDSSLAVPRLGRVLGKNLKHSIGFTTSSEVRNFLTQIRLDEGSDGCLTKKARIVMEVNMDSTPRTVQFFVNGKAGTYYVSGIPESVRIGFSADVMGTSVQIASIIHSTLATPLAKHMKELKWNDIGGELIMSPQVFSLSERYRTLSFFRESYTEPTHVRTSFFIFLFLGTLTSNNSQFDSVILTPIKHNKCVYLSTVVLSNSFFVI
ncbi:putative Cyclin-dependent kinase 2 [Blattamonas nauphoetae]|uniref:non-specific serine/threonine protein kinase n=1 Tax=Blattamonas nauphoetae TaxID=2049346 RepID=A0ABQ9WR73_9EUKA|nr:putative Cyclin-dependent kinase 2 [Blattamonas nauphoetae]